MRILEVIEFFSPSMGGSAQVVYQVSRHLARRGHEVTVVASDFSIDGSRFSDCWSETQLFRSVLSRWGFHVTPGLIPWARNHLAGYKIIHLHNVRTFQNAVIGAVARRLSVPYVVSAHGSLPLSNGRAAAKRVFDALIGRSLVQGASKMLALSAVEMEQYLAAGVDERRISIVPNGMDLSEYADLPARGQIRQRLDLPLDVPLVLYLGRLHRIKGVDVLLAAFVRLLAALVHAHLVIAGPDDGDLRRLRALAQKAGLDQRVHFSGGLYGSDKLAALVDADLVVIPSQYEMFGMVPFEAILCGKPVVVSQDTGAGRLIREAGAGYLAPHGDDAALAGAMLEALTDSVGAQRRVAAGQAYVRECLNWERIAGELDALYATQVAGPARP